MANTNLYCDRTISATRFAVLLTTPVSEYEPLLRRWVSEDARPFRRAHYRLARAAIESFHRRDRSVSDLRSELEEWRFNNSTDLREQRRYRDNARATEQYLDAHAEREMIVFPRRELECVVDRVRVLCRPHLFAECAGAVLIWLECSEHLDAATVDAKCHVTRWVGERMRAPNVGVEAVHSATRQIITRDALPAHFERTAVAICRAIIPIWSRAEASVGR